MCGLDKKTLNNKIQAVAGESTEYALMDVFGPGHVSYVAGAVAYVAKCVPVEVSMASIGNCSHEIPVLHHNVTKFVNPITMVLTETPRYVPCSDLMPVRWKISHTAGEDPPMM